MDVEEPQEKKHPFDIGAALVSAREAQSLSALDIAAKLNLTPSVIACIELNQFEGNTPLAFMRGYVRAYAMFTNADLDLICNEFDLQFGEGSENNPKPPLISHYRVSKRRELNSNSSVFKVITVIILLALIGFAVWGAWDNILPRFNQKEATYSIELDGLQSDKAVNEPQSESLNHDMEDDRSAAEESLSENDKAETKGNTEAIQSELQATEESSQAAISDLSSSLPNTTSEKLEAPATGLTESAAMTEVELAAEGPSSNLSGQWRNVSATFSFSGDCWVQITDAKGEVLAVGTKPAGKIMTLVGAAPLSVNLGVPSVVAIEFEGEAFDMSQFNPTRSAQFTLQ